jgi:hypothetical protein
MPDEPGPDDKCILIRFDCQYGWPMPPDVYDSMAKAQEAINESALAGEAVIGPYCLPARLSSSRLSGVQLESIFDLLQQVAQDVSEGKWAKDTLPPCPVAVGDRVAYVYADEGGLDRAEGVVSEVNIDCVIVKYDDDGGDGEFSRDEWHKLEIVEQKDKR